MLAIALASCDADPLARAHHEPASPASLRTRSYELAAGEDAWLILDCPPDKPLLESAHCTSEPPIPIREEQDGEIARCHLTNVLDVPSLALLRLSCLTE